MCLKGKLTGGILHTAGCPEHCHDSEAETVPPT